jgi:hypothetical protein
MRIENHLLFASKKYFLLIISILLFPSLYGRDKEYEQIIQECDVTQYFETDSGSANLFWETIVANHIPLKKYQKKLAKNDKLACKANADVKSLLGLVVSEHRALKNHDSDSIWLNTSANLKKDLLGSLSNSVKFHLVETDLLNAVTTPKGDIFFYQGLISKIYPNWISLMGVGAHELAHYFLRHAELNKYYDLKEKKKNDIWAGVLITLSAASSAAEAYTNGNRKNDAGRETLDIINQTRRSTVLAHFEYSRTEEFEADIVAYRFLEFIGEDPMAYVSALSLIGQEADDYFSPWDDHPTMPKRIALLQYIHDNYPFNYCISSREEEFEESY